MSDWNQSDQLPSLSSSSLSLLTDNTSDEETLRSQLTDSNGFSILLTVLVLLGVLSLAANSMFLLILYNASVYHRNLRVLLAHISLMAVWMGVGRSIKSGYVLVQLHLQPDAGLDELDLLDCRLDSWLFNVHPANVVAFAGVCAGLERLYALLRFRVYSKRAIRFIWLPVCLLVAAAWMPSVLLAVCAFAAGQPTRCLSLHRFRDPPRAAVPLAVAVAAAAATASLWLAAYVQSRRLLVKMAINRAQQSLGARFQLSQNFGAIRTMTPWIGWHVGLGLLAALLLWTSSGVWTSVDPLRHVQLLHAGFAVQLLNTLLFPLVCLRSSAVLRKRLYHLVRFRPYRANTIQPVSRNVPIQPRPIRHSEIQFTFNANRRPTKKLEFMHVFSTLH